MRTRVAVAYERGAPLRIEEVLVRSPRADEVTVRIAACGICASDLHVWRSGEGIAFPAVLGHEAAGVVEATGPDVRDLAVGSRVLITWVPRCGTCRACRAGRPHVCAAIRTSVDDGSLSLGGRQLARYMGVAGLAERVVVTERSLILVPDALSLKAACLVGCGALDLDSLAGPDHPLEKLNDAMEEQASGRAVRPRVVFGEGRV